MTEPKDREERAILDALGVLEADDPEQALARLADERVAGPEPEEAEEVLRRLYVETLGLVALSEEPVTPSAAARDRVMAAVAAQREGRGHGSRHPAEVVPFSASSGAGSEPSREASRPEPRGEAPMSAPRRRSWPAVLAAGLVTAALGLSAWMGAELHQARLALDRLEQEHAHMAERLSRQEDVIRRAGASHGLLSAVTRPGVELCPLRPVGDSPPVPGAFAVLYMPPDSEEWYLVASNLDAAPGGVYAVWLNTPEGPVPAGILQGGAEASLRIVPPRLEEQGGMASIAVTLEPAPGLAEPTGPVVLFGDDRMSVS